MALFNVNHINIYPPCNVCVCVYVQATVIYSRVGVCVCVGGDTLGHEAEWSVAHWDLEHLSLPTLLIRSSNCNANADFLTLIFQLHPFSSLCLFCLALSFHSFIYLFIFYPRSSDDKMDHFPYHYSS